MKAITDWAARNRRWIGGIALALWTAAQSDQALMAEHPRLMMYGGAVAAYILASGLHRPDSVEKLKQQVEAELDKAP